MRRQIKFRGKAKDGEWWYGSLVYLPDSQTTHIIPCGTCKGKDIYCDFVEVDANTVGQNTGLSDCNGKELYEGDIIAIRVNPCEVKWNDSISAFCVRFYFEKQAGVKSIGAWLSEEPNSVIIGNIHDNPELLTPNR